MAFVAKFNKTSGSPFTSDKRGNFPYIGEVLAGPSNGTIINGTIFEREGLKTNQLYLCENVEEEYQGTKQVRVQIITEVNALEYMAMRKDLGAPIVKINKAEVAAELPAAEATVEAEAEIV